MWKVYHKTLKHSIKPQWNEIKKEKKKNSKQFEPKSIRKRKLKSTQSKLKCENALLKLHYKKTVSEKNIL